MKKEVLATLVGLAITFFGGLAISREGKIRARIKKLEEERNYWNFQECKRKAEKEALEEEIKKLKEELKNKEEGK